MYFENIVSDFEAILTYKDYVKKRCIHLMKNDGYTIDMIKKMLDEGLFNTEYQDYHKNTQKLILEKYFE
jgi:DNA-binding transcriptional MerR regulator